MKDTQIDSSEDYDKDLGVSEENRKLKLIRIITLQVIAVGLVFLCVYLYLGLYFISGLIILGVICALFTLWYVTHFTHVILAANIINVLYLIVISSNCYLLVTNSYSYLCWYLTVPLISGSLINIRGLVVYSSIALIILSVLIFVHSETGYLFPPNLVLFLDLLNYILVMQLITFMSYSILQINYEYSQELADRNFMLKGKQEKLHYLARHDSLTNLPNRLYFTNKLQDLINTINKQTHSITLFYMDVNEFKSVNDKYGHDIGDQLLLAVSKRLKNCLRKSDFIARLSGDEFTAIIVHKKRERLPDLLYQRISEEFLHSFKINGIEIISSLSIGKSQWPEYATSYEELLNIADKNMYHNKRKMKVQS